MGTRAVETKPAAVVHPTVAAPIHVAPATPTIVRKRPAAAATTVTRVAHAHVAPETAAPAASPVAAVPETQSEATVGNGNAAATTSRTHGKSGEAHGKGAKRNLVEPQPLALQSAAPSGEAGDGSKPGHASHGQGSGNNAGGRVSTPPVLPEPVTPAVESAVQSADQPKRGLSGR